MLLHSCPDTVHGVPLRETQTSTPLTEGSSHAKGPQIGITPAVADCRYRAPLSPRLRDFMSIPVLNRKVNVIEIPGTVGHITSSARKIIFRSTSPQKPVLRLSVQWQYSTPEYATKPAAFSAAGSIGEGSYLSCRAPACCDIGCASFIERSLR